LFVKFSPSYETKQFESSELNLKTHQKHHYLYENFFWGKKELGYFLKTSKMLKFSLKIQVLMKDLLTRLDLVHY